MALSIVRKSQQRFYLDLEECGVRTPDLEGHWCADLDAAKSLATRAARAIMAAEVLEGKLCVGCTIDVFDDQRTKVATIAFREAVEIVGQ